MTEASGSYRRILFATSAVGGASLVNILLGIVRLKVAALVLGTAGIGLIGLLQSVIGTGAAIGGLGISQSATRQVAAKRAQGSDRAARRTLFAATAALALVSAMLVWALRRPIASLLLGDVSSSDAVGWMGLGVGLTIVAGSQTALLAGLGRVGDVARVSLLTACLSTVAAIAFLLLLGDGAIVPYLLSVPVASTLAGWLYAARANPPCGPADGSRSAAWRQLIGLGTAVMITSVIVNLSQLAIRGVLSQRVGMEELGLYQAASVISVTYLAFILQAMSTDFYPRLSALPAGSTEANRLINEQTEIALLLGGPVILAMIGLADAILYVLYTSEFAKAATLLRLQMLGDVLRLASWPLGFALLAAGRGRIHVFLELATCVTLVGTTVALVPAFGIEAAGLGLIAMNALYVPSVLLAVRTKSSFRWSRSVWRGVLVLGLAGVTLVLIGTWSSLIAAIAGIGMAAVGATMAYNRLRTAT